MPNTQAPQPAMSPDMGAMGGDASFMGGGQDMMGGDPNMMNMNNMGGDPNMMDNSLEQPEMGSNPFGNNDAEMSSDPEKKIESLVGKASSIIRKELNGDGIDKHEDKKKEVLGMLASAVIDGMDDEQRNGIVDYLSDKLKGEGESDGDSDNDGGMEDNAQQQDGGMMDMGGDMDMANQTPQQMVENIVKEMTINALNKTRKKPARGTVKTDAKYKKAPYVR